MIRIDHGILELCAESGIDILAELINKYNDNLITKINQQLNLGEKDLLLYSYYHLLKLIMLHESRFCNSFLTSYT